MPRSIRWLDDAYAQLQALPPVLHKGAQEAAGSLLSDPYPEGSAPDQVLPDTFILRTGFVTIFYRLVGDEVDVVGVWANS
jgi:plasmid stabilization system protein ParE